MEKQGGSRETPNLSLLPSDLLALPTGRTQPEPEVKGAGSSCPWSAEVSLLEHRARRKTGHGFGGEASGK